MAPTDNNNDNSQRRKWARPSRIIIYPKDIQILTGKSYRHALYLNKEIRTYFQKQKHQLLTVYEFAQYTGINPESILPHLK